MKMYMHEASIWKSFHLTTIKLWHKKLVYNRITTIDQFKKLTPKIADKKVSQPAITCSKLTIEILEQVVKYVQS